MVLEAKKHQIPTSLTEFINWEFPIDGYKYEWFDGEVIRFEKMKRRHLKLISVLQRTFDNTFAKQQNGLLIAEQDVTLSAIQLRRPDLAYFSGEQIDSSDVGDEPIPEFVIEIISPTDDAFLIEQKLIEYFKAGVRVVWHILPEHETVYVYTGRKIVQICTGDDICSAKPVLNDFEITVNKMFAA